MRAIGQFSPSGRLSTLAMLAMVAAVSTLSSPAEVRGQSVTFAQISQVDTGDKFTYTGSNASAATFVGTHDVKFQFQNVGALGVFLGEQTATLTLTAQTREKATLASGIVSQVFVDSALPPPLALSTILIVATDGPYTGKTLLKVEFSGSVLERKNSTTAAFFATSGEDLDTNPPVPAVVNFTSDILTFDTSVARDFALNLTNMSTGLDINGTTNFLKNFTSNLGGTFAAAVVPEPSTLLMFGTGIGAVLAVRTRRRRALAHA